MSGQADCYNFLAEIEVENPIMDFLTKALLMLWIFLMIPWVVLAPLSGMGFDAGDTWQIHVLVWSIWTYPVMLAAGLVALWRGKMRGLLLLPFLNVAAVLVSHSLS